MWAPEGIESRLSLEVNGETRELILETLSHICNHPNFMVNVYTNYDCDINCENLFERLIDFLTKVRCADPSLFALY